MSKFQMVKALALHEKKKHEKNIVIEHAIQKSMLTEFSNINIVVCSPPLSSKHTIPEYLSEECCSCIELLRLVKSKPVDLSGLKWFWRLVSSSSTWRHFVLSLICHFCVSHVRTRCASWHQLFQKWKLTIRSCHRPLNFWPVPQHARLSIQEQSVVLHHVHLRHRVLTRTCLTCQGDLLHKMLSYMFYTLLLQPLLNRSTGNAWNM